MSSHDELLAAEFKDWEAALAEIDRLRAKLDGVVEMYLCEPENLILKPGILYQFRTDWMCSRCRKLASLCAAAKETGDADKD